MSVRRLFSTNRIRIVEVGPRDGLQNERQVLSTQKKLTFIKMLVESGLEMIEATSFVSPKWIPQMADAKDIVSAIAADSALQEAKLSFPVLIPNRKGLDDFLCAAQGASNLKDLAVFTAASDTFSKKNTNCTVAESLQRLKEVVQVSSSHNLRSRGYVSCIVKCPYEGHVDPDAVLRVASELLSMGCFEISLGDTIGAGTPYEIEVLLKHLLKRIPAEKLAIHCHNTYGQALANIQRAIDMGIRTVDASCAGLGGCPYAPGASGNVPTEDLVYMLQNGASGPWDLGKISLSKLMEAGAFITEAIGIKTRSCVSQALQGKSREAPEF